MKNRTNNYTEAEIVAISDAGYYFRDDVDWMRDTDQCFSTITKNTEGIWNLYCNYGYAPEDGHGDEDWRTFKTLQELLDFL